MKKRVFVALVFSSLTLLLVSCGDDKPATKEASPPSLSDDTRTATHDLLREEPARPPEQHPTLPPAGVSDQEAMALAAKQTYEDAMAFAKNNPTSYKSVIERLEEARASLEGTEWKDKITAKLDAVKKEFEEKGNEAYLAIEKAVKEFIANRDFQAALKTASEFPKAFDATQGARKAAALKDRIPTEQQTIAEAELKAATTAAQNNQFSKALELYKKLKEYAPEEMHGQINEAITNLEHRLLAEGEAAYTRFLQGYDAIFDEVVKLVEAGQIDDALSKCEALASSGDYGLAACAKPDDATIIHFNNLFSNVKQAATLVKKVFEYFSTFVGRTTEVPLRSKKENALIEKVEDGTLTLRIGDKSRTVTFGDMRQEDVIATVFTDASPETLSMIIAFWMASGKPHIARKALGKGEEIGHNLEAWKEKITAMEEYLKLASERKKEASMLKEKAKTMERLNKTLERVVAEFKTESYEACLSGLSSILKIGKSLPPEVLKELSMRCSSLCGHSFVSLVQACRTTCKPCNNTGAIICPRCRGSMVIMVERGNNKWAQVQCPQCKGKGNITCRKCYTRRTKSDYVNLEKGFMEAEMRH